jgi:hypothetical protein
MEDLMNNYAGRDDVDINLMEELMSAGIPFVDVDWIKKHCTGEVKTGVIGQLNKWSFKRAWYYWVAEGPGVPPEYARRIYATHGKDVRVEGHAGSPDPIEYNNGFAVGLYHIDTQEGLTAFADLLKQIERDARVKLEVENNR